MTGYVIKSGDTLGNLARRNGTTVRALLQANPQIANPDLIYAGATLTIPEGPAAPVTSGVSTALSQGKAADSKADRGKDAGAVCNCEKGKPPVNPTEEDMGAQSEAEVLELAPQTPADPELEAIVGRATDGMTVAEVQSAYLQKTGRTLSQETLKTLFTDPYAARKMLMEDSTLNVELRDILNRNVPAKESDIDMTKWRKLTKTESSFHDPANKVKYVSEPGGHLEAIFNKDGSLDTTSIYRGTFNYFGPDNGNGHNLADVDPFWVTDEGKEWSDVHEWQKKPWQDGAWLDYKNSGSALGLKGYSGLRRGAKWTGDQAVEVWDGAKTGVGRAWDGIRSYWGD